jgi:hypothetical protein
MKTNRLVTASIVCAFLFFSPVFVLADTLVSGPIFGDVTWTLAQSPYRVVANAIVMSDSSLTIEPGVLVRFDGTNALQIDGKLVARGTQPLPITFTPSGTNNWGYIYFRTSSIDATYDAGGDYVSGSILEYCTVEKAGGASVNYNGAIRLEDAHPFINHCTIRDNIATGIFAWSLSDALKITNCEVRNNTSSDNHGGFSINGGIITIADCNIVENISYAGCGGIALGSSGDIHSNNITGNTGTLGGGISFGGDVTVRSNIICHNTATHGAGIFMYYGSGAVSDNIICWNNALVLGGATYGGGLITRNILVGNESEGDGGCIVSAITVSNNIILNNIAESYSGGICSSGTLSNNTICGNTASNGSAIWASTNLSYNTICGNIAVGSSPTYTLYNNAVSPINYNNIFNNSAAYEFWNDVSNTSPDVNAATNWWGTNSASEIEDKIYHFVDDSSKGFVNYFPFDNQIRTDCPVSPPTGLTISTTANSIILNWSANPEPDVVGYKVYWGTTEPPLFGNVVNVGNTTNYTITPLPQGMYYVGVTACDTSYNPANDDPCTILNDNQTNGNESAYASTIAFIGTDPRSLTLVSPVGNELIAGGSHYDIIWESTGIIGNIQIKLSTDNGASWQNIITAINDGSYSWLVPQINSDQALIRISDSSNLAITDTSDSSFTIFVCNKSLPGDINKDCYVDFYDFAKIAGNWLQCGNPFDPDCMP